jgi:hypothetical protein
MKKWKIESAISKFKTGGSILIAGLFAMVGCMDDKTTEVQPVPVSYVSIYNASPDAPGLDVIVDERRINSNPFDYTDYSGYLNFFTGNRNIKVNAANATNSYVDTTFNLLDGKAYSLFLIDRASKLEALLVRDSAAAPEAGKAMIRFIHLSPDADALDVVAKGATDTTAFNATSFKQASQFQSVNAESVTFDVKKAGAADTLLSSNNINLQAGGYYTVIVRGFANPPAGVSNGLTIEVL